METLQRDCTQCRGTGYIAECYDPEVPFRFKEKKCEKCDGKGYFECALFTLEEGQKLLNILNDYEKAAKALHSSPSCDYDWEFNHDWEFMGSTMNEDLLMCKHCGTTKREKSNWWERFKNKL